MKTRKAQSVTKSDSSVAVAEVTQLVPEALAVSTIENAIASGGLLANVSSKDVSAFVVQTLDNAAGGMRKAILAIDASIRTGDEFAGEVKTHLSSRYAVGTVNCIFTAARKTVPALRDAGISPHTVDVYNLRSVNKALCDKSHKAHKAVVKAIREGKGAAAVKAEADKIAGKAQRQPAGAVNPATTVNTLDGTVAKIRAEVASLARDKTFGEKQTRNLLLKIARELGATADEFAQAAGKKK